MSGSLGVGTKRDWTAEGHSESSGSEGGVLFLKKCFDWSIVDMQYYLFYGMLFNNYIHFKMLTMVSGDCGNNFVYMHYKDSTNCAI